MKVGDKVVKEGDWISIDGTTGEVFLGKLKTMVPDIKDPWLIKLLRWADEFRRLGVLGQRRLPARRRSAPASTAPRASACAAPSTCSSSPSACRIVQKMIMTDLPSERREALETLLPFQREDFDGLFRAMDGLPVIIRLIDPPLHEFLPNHRRAHARAGRPARSGCSTRPPWPKIDNLLEQVRLKESLLKRVEGPARSQPDAGHARRAPGHHDPRADPDAGAGHLRGGLPGGRTKGVDVHPEIMIPLTSHVNELKRQREVLEAEAKKVMAEQGIEVEYKFGTMIEIPRAALTADEIAEYAAVLLLRHQRPDPDDLRHLPRRRRGGFLMTYLSGGHPAGQPLRHHRRGRRGRADAHGRGKGPRRVEPDLECGICGEHGGDPESIMLCHELGLNYVSCSPFRVPIARLAAAHAALKERVVQE